jgi:hypothetical protein
MTMQKTNTQVTQFKDYPADQIQAKLNQVIEYESKYGSNTVTQAWRKWCESIEYRKREWQFRQSVAEYAKYNAHKALL